MLLVAHRAPADALARNRFERAGATHYELDVRIDGDGRLVVSHFQPLLRIPGWVEVDGTRLRRSGRPDPPLIDAVRAIPPAASVLLDPKERSGPRRRRLVELLAQLPRTERRFCVSTGRVDDLTELAAAGFETWLTVATRRELRDGARGFAAVTVRHQLLDRGVIAGLRADVETVVAWTVNDVRRATTLAAWGVQGITSDSAAVLEAVRVIASSR